MILELIRGDDRIRDVTVTSGGLPVDLTTVEAISFTAKWAISDPDADAVIEKGLGAGIEVDVTDTNVAHVTFDAADTVDLEAPVLLPFDVEIVDENGKTRTVVLGWLHIVADVTRNPGLGS